MATRQEAVAAAAQVYRAILSDPQRAAELREHRARQSEHQQQDQSAAQPRSA